MINGGVKIISPFFMYVPCIVTGVFSACVWSERFMIQKVRGLIERNENENKENENGEI